MLVMFKKGIVNGFHRDHLMDLYTHCASYHQVYYWPCSESYGGIFLKTNLP